MLTNVVKQARFLVNENSTTILTGLGVTGVVSTAILTGRSTVKAVRLLEEQKEREDLAEVEELSTMETVKTVWTVYIPPVLMGAGTIACIVASNRIASKRVAALVIASGISERALAEYKEKVVEKLGEHKARDIRDSIAEDRVANDPVTSKEVVITGGGDVLCYDQHTGRYFMSSHEAIKKAENAINYELVHFCAASLSQFYDEIGLPPTTYSDTVGWDVNNHMEVYITTAMSADNRPCLAIDFSNPPSYDYNRHRY